MKKWEYKVVDWWSLNREGGLDAFGEKGWELVSVVESVFGAVHTLKYYFKRNK